MAPVNDTRRNKRTGLPSGLHGDWHDINGAVSYGYHAIGIVARALDIVVNSGVAFVP